MLRSSADWGEDRAPAAVWSDGQREVVDARTPLSALMEPETGRRDLQDLEAIAKQIVEIVLGLSPLLDPEEKQEEICAQIRELVERERSRTLVALLGYIWNGARNPWAAMKNVLAVTRRVKPAMIQGASQSEVAFLLQETRAAVQAREKRTIEDLLIRWGVKGFKLLGGARSEESRRKCAERAMGNTNRRNGGKKVKK